MELIINKIDCFNILNNNFLDKDKFEAIRHLSNIYKEVSNVEIFCIYNEWRKEVLNSKIIYNPVCTVKKKTKRSNTFKKDLDFLRVLAIREDQNYKKLCNAFNMVIDGYSTKEICSVNEIEYYALRQIKQYIERKNITQKVVIS